jgi:alkaline phosphatase D
MGDTFQHGIASGDPLTDRVVIWTRVSRADGDVRVRWKLARDEALGDIVAEGETTAAADRDHTVHVDVEGLEPGTTYHYGFEAEDESSPAGRTKTLPDAPERLRFAMCSCAKFNAGFFNAYARIAERDDLDFLLHLGDYIYEASNTPPKTQTPGADIGRPFDPVGECRTLADYRTRYSQYRSDPDVQRLHAALPMIATLDDHELADGAWAGGADAHDPAEHGPWTARRDEAFRARWEWLPARAPDRGDPTRVFRTVEVGELARLHLLDVRSRRDQPALEPEANDPSRSMLGAEQHRWLEESMSRSAPGWTIVATPAILTHTWLERPAEPVLTALLKLKLMDEDGEGPDEDQWDGYPAERERLLRLLRATDDAVVLSGDIHVSVAGEVRDDDGPVAVEFTTPSLTSQNLDEKLGLAPRSEEIKGAEDAFTAAFDHVQWCELASHGYVVVDVDSERLRAEWWHVDDVLQRVDGEQRGAAFEVRRGEIGLTAASRAAGSAGPPSRSRPGR